MNADIFQSHTISYVLSWIFSIPIFFGVIAIVIQILFDKTVGIPILYNIWIAICIILFSPIRYILLQFIVASVYPFQSISALFSIFYLMLIVPIAFSIQWAIGLALPLLGSFYLTFGRKDSASKLRIIFGSLATPVILFLGSFLFFTVLPYAGYVTHMLKARDLICATNGPAEYFFKYVVEFGTPLQYPEFAHDIGLGNLTSKERLRSHVASIYMGDDEVYYYVKTEFPKYADARIEIEKMKKAGKTIEAWPEMTEAESDDLAYITMLIFQKPFEEEDLKRVAEINKNYEKRVGRSISEEESFIAIKFIELSSEYNREYNICMLESFDTKKPFISDKLNKLSAEMRHLGLFSKVKSNLDMQVIKSVATGEPWKDKDGNERQPPTREDILEAKRQGEMATNNLKQFLDAIK